MSRGLQAPASSRSSEFTDALTAEATTAVSSEIQGAALYIFKDESKECWLYFQGDSGPNVPYLLLLQAPQGITDVLHVLSG